MWLPCHTLSNRHTLTHPVVAQQQPPHDQPALLRQRRSRLGRPTAMAAAPKPQLSGSLIVSDCAALVVYGLLASALKAFAQRAAGER